MDFPSRHPERARLFAITLWTAFLGALLNLAVTLVLLPEDLVGFGWSELSIGFLCSWIIIAVPVSLALLLAAPLLAGNRGHRDER